MFTLIRPRHRFPALRWSDLSPPEDFSFYDCRLLFDGERQWEGLVYYPHPDTKPDHFQAPDILEILTRRIPGLDYGDRLTLALDSDQIRLVRSVDPP